MRRPFTLFSVILHAIVIAAGLYAQILADSAQLPTPHMPMMFDGGSFMPVDITLPAPRTAQRARTRDAMSENAAPIVPPTGLAPDTDREGDPPATPDAMIVGTESGPPSFSGRVGVIENVPPPPPPPVAPIHLHSGMRVPVKTVHVAPVFPSIARSAQVQGVVILEAVLDASGRVESVRVLRSIPLLDQEAVEAVRQWRFTPALLNGEPVPVVMTVTVNFTLRE